MGSAMIPRGEQTASDSASAERYSSFSRRAIAMYETDSMDVEEARSIILEEAHWILDTYPGLDESRRRLDIAGVSRFQHRTGEYGDLPFAAASVLGVPLDEVAYTDTYGRTRLKRMSPEVPRVEGDPSRLAWRNREFYAMRLADTMSAHYEVIEILRKHPNGWHIFNTLEQWALGDNEGDRRKCPDYDRCKEDLAMLYVTMIALFGPGTVEEKEHEAS